MPKEQQNRAATLLLAAILNLALGIMVHVSVPVTTVVPQPAAGLVIDPASNAACSIVLTLHQLLPPAGISCSLSVICLVTIPHSEDVAVFLITTNSLLQEE